MADIKTTTVTGALTANGIVTGLTVISTNAASGATECVRKGEMDTALALKVGTSDARLTDARVPSGTAVGSEVTGTYPNSLGVADRTVNQALATPGNVGSLTSLLSWLAGAIKAATGTTNWFDAPATSLATAAAHIASTANPHVVTATQVGLGNVTNVAQLAIANNLSDVANVTTARTSLGLGGAALLSVGTTAGTVAAGDDSRMTNARTPSVHATSHKLGGTDPIRLDEFALPTASVSCGNQKIILVGTPTAGTDAANKDYADSTRSTFRARLVATSNISLSGTGTLDGVAIAAGNRILAVGQSDASQNGLWTAASGAWTRAGEADTGTELAAASKFTIAEGTAGAGTSWLLTTVDPIIVGTTDLAISQWPLAGSGLDQLNATLSIEPGGVTDTHLGNRTVNQALATPADTGILTSLLSWITGRLIAITGKADWKTAPGTTLELAAAHIANVTTNPHAVDATDVGLGAVTNALQLVAANNLSDLVSASTARTSLGLGGAAVLSVGTTAGTVAAGNDARFGVKFGNVLWVDVVNGNDTTGTTGRIDLSYATCAGAKADAGIGDLIYVLPGAYNEKDLFQDGLNWFFLPGAEVTYSGSGNGGIFDDGVNGSNAAGICTVYGFGKFFNLSGGTSPHAVNITQASSQLRMTAIEVYSANSYAVAATNGSVTLRCDRLTGAGGVHLSGSMGSAVTGYDHVIISNVILAGTASFHGVYLEAGTATIEADIIQNTAAGNALRFKNGINEVRARVITSASDVGCYVEAPTTTQRCKVINAKISSTLNTAAGRAVTIVADNLVLQNCVLVSNTVGTPAVESVYSAAAQNLRVYGHAMANLAKHANVTLLCGTLEVDTDVI